MKPPLRTKSVGTKVSEAEFAALEQEAQAAGSTLSEWVRNRLLVALESGNQGVQEGSATSAEILLAEVLAFRSLYLNLQFRSGKGELSESELRSLIERVDATKADRARERLKGSDPPS